MRRILLALIVLGCTAPVAEAARQDTRGAPGRPAQQVAKPAQPTTAARPQSAQRNLRPGDVRTSREGVVSRGSSAARVPRETAAANCRRQGGRTICGPARSGVAGWQNGLPVANYAQQDCPAGTFATLASGHDDVIRCMPF